jgi:hypothetical protein
VVFRSTNVLVSKKSQRQMLHKGQEGKKEGEKRWRVINSRIFPFFEGLKGSAAALLHVPRVEGCRRTHVQTRSREEQKAARVAYNAL